MANLRNRHDLYDDIENIKDAFRIAGKDVSGKAKEMLTDSIENLNERTTYARKNVEDYTAAKPFKSLGIALAAGFVLGFLIRK